MARAFYFVFDFRFSKARILMDCSYVIFKINAKQQLTSLQSRIKLRSVNYR